MRGLRIRIYGAGVAGSVLAHLLAYHEAVEVEVVDPRANRRGHECAWGTFTPTMGPLLEDLGLNLEEYVLTRPEVVMMGPYAFENASMVIIDKPRLLEALWPRREVAMRDTHVDDADLKVDATGSARAFMGRRGDRYAVAGQMRVREPIGLPEGTAAFVPVHKGYAWFWDMGSWWHVGLATESTAQFWTLWPMGYKAVCRCTNGACDLGKEPESAVTRIYTGGLERSPWDPYSRFVGVGEAIGTTSPITGEGIYPAALSAKFLYEAIRRTGFIEVDLRWYKRRLEKAFKRTRAERAAIDRGVFTPGLVIEAIRALRAYEAPVDPSALRAYWWFVREVLRGDMVRSISMQEV